MDAMAACMPWLHVCHGCMYAMAACMPWVITKPSQHIKLRIPKNDLPAHSDAAAFVLSSSNFTTELTYNTNVHVNK
jgi:hypothetical protein